MKIILGNPIISLVLQHLTICQHLTLHVLPIPKNNLVIETKSLSINENPTISQDQITLHKPLDICQEHRLKHDKMNSMKNQDQISQNTLLADYNSNPILTQGLTPFHGIHDSTTSTIVDETIAPMRHIDDLPLEQESPTLDIFVTDQVIAEFIGLYDNDHKDDFDIDLEALVESFEFDMSQNHTKYVNQKSIPHVNEAKTPYQLGSSTFIIYWAFSQRRRFQVIVSTYIMMG